MMKFTYSVVFEKDGDLYHLVQYNSPYQNLERALEDLEHAFNVDGYRCINISELGPNRYEAEIDMLMVPNEDHTYDQLFILKKLDQLDA